MTPTTERQHFHLGNHRVYYEVAGQGEPLIMVHGLSGSSRWWDHNIDFFAQHFRVYAVDLLGFGGSSGQPFELERMADLLQAWMDHLKIDCARIIGHSMGGLIAAELTADAQERVEKLVLVDAAALPLGRTYWQNVLSLIWAVRYAPLDFWPILFGDALRAGPFTILRAAHQLLAADISDKIDEIRVPTLLVWGERDPLVPLEMGRRLEERMRYTDLIVLKGVGHNPMWDKPEAFNRAVLDFLR